MRDEVDKVPNAQYLRNIACDIKYTAFRVKIEVIEVFKGGETTFLCWL